MQDKPSITITPARLAFALSLFTLASIMFQGSKFLLDTSYRLSSLEEKWAVVESTQRELTSELRNLSASLNELNLVLREVQVRQQNQERGLK